MRAEEVPARASVPAAQRMVGGRSDVHGVTGLPGGVLDVPDDDPSSRFQPQALTGLLSPPPWLRDLGATAWLAVGATLLVVGVVWLLSLTNVIVAPVLTAAVVAAVASPVVDRLARRRLPRALGSALLLLTLAALAAGIVLLVLAALRSQSAEISSRLSAAQGTIADWLTSVGVDEATAQQAREDAASATTGAVQTLLQGLAHGLRGLSSLVVFLAFTALSLFFLLKDGPQIRAWAERHMRVPEPVAHQMTGRVQQSLRGYFLGVTIVALFNAAVVALGALILGVPLKGTIAAVTFLGAYVPYLGAWSAGIFAVLVALGSGGADAAIGMAVVQLLANGVLQQLVQPIAYGTVLGIHPLAVLIVTIAAGSVFGAVGLVLAAPLTSAATRIAGDLASAARAGPVA